MKRQEYLPNYKKATTFCSAPDPVASFNSALCVQISNAINRILEAEIAAFLNYQKYESKGRKTGNSRNGCYYRSLKSSFGKLSLKIPRDRIGKFKQVLIPSFTTDTKMLEDLAFSFYRYNYSYQEIANSLEDIYGRFYSHEDVSKITLSVYLQVSHFYHTQLDKEYSELHVNIDTLKRYHHLDSNLYMHYYMGVNKEGKSVLFAYSLSALNNSDDYSQIVMNWRQRGLKSINSCFAPASSGFSRICKLHYPNLKIIKPNNGC